MINKQGIIQDNQFIEYLREADGAIFYPVCRHVNPSAQLFNQTDNFANGVYHNSGLWLDTQVFNTLDSWELLWIQKTTENGVVEKYRWVQNKNPLLATWTDVQPGQVTFNSGNEYTRSSYGGLFKKNSSSYLVIADGSAADWWGAIGCWTAYQGGLPGYPMNVVTTGEIDLYVRVPESYVRVNNLGQVLAESYYEI